MIIIDALPHRYVDPGLTPNLWRQGVEGARAPNGGMSLPVSVTYANHAAFVTGADPAVTGVFGNKTWIDGEGWVRSYKAGPRATTLFGRVAEAGGHSVIIVGDHKLIAQMGGERADHVWPPDGWIPDGTPRCEFGYPSNAAVVDAARSADLDADFVVLHLNQPDTTSHIYGPDSTEALEQYRATDIAYGQLIDLLAEGWGNTVVVTLSDHDQEPITNQEPIALAAVLDEIDGLELANDGTAALIHGPVDRAVLGLIHTVPGVEDTMQLSPDVWMVWSEPGRMFEAAPIPLGGQHGSPRCRTQVAIVSGGDARVEGLADWIESCRPSALDWAPRIADLLNLDQADS